MNNLQFLAVFLVLCFSLSTVNAGLVAGRSIPDGRDAGITLKMGQIASLEASVKDQSSSFLRQDFSLEDLGVDGGYVTYGLSADKAWRFFGLQLDLLYVGISEDITAQQSYSIDVDSLGYSGADYLRIEANTDIKAEFSGGIVELHGLITPVSLQFSESLSFAPWASLGFMVMGGNYDIDNGKTTATVSYGPFSESIAVGGTASGLVGLAVPDVGFGGEIRIGKADDLNLVLNGNYSFLPMGDSLGRLLSKESGSDVTIDYTNIKINGSLEIPRGDEGKAWVIGIQYESIEASSEMNLDDGIFRKNIDFSMTILTGSIGLRF